MGRRGLPLELAAVWLLLGVVAAAVLVTYSRLDPSELYHVSHDGLAGGGSRVVVLLNFPFALVAIAVLFVLVDQLRGVQRGAAVTGIALSAAVFWPGVVDPGDLDVKPVNGIAFAGVVIAALLSALVWRAGGLEPAVRGIHEKLRLGIAAVAFLASIPWMLADLGLYADRIPLLGRLYLTGELTTQPGDPVAHRAVHHGHHHGMDGTLLVWCALLLAPLLATLATTWLRRLTAAYLALMLSYGAANLANDLWLEQVVKRGWTAREIPDLLEPRLSLGWGAIVLAAAVTWVVFVRSDVSGTRAEPAA